MTLANLYAAAKGERADDGLVKVIVPSQKLIWLWIPKNAGGSISRTLVEAYGEDAIPLEVSFGRIWRLNPALKSFRVVAVKRNPFTRIVSCWLNKIAHAESFNPRFLKKYPSLRPGMGFGEFAEWLNSPEGGDGKADPHWISQRRQLQQATEIVAFEDLPDAVSALGVKPEALSHRNRYTEMAELAGLDGRPLLDWYDRRSAQQIGERYAKDLKVLGYDIPEELRALI